MPRIPLEQIKLLVRLLLNLRLELVVGVPKTTRGVMSHNCFTRPARRSPRASFAKESSKPAAASREISRSKSQARISATCSSLSCSIAFSISWTVLTSGI